MINRAAIILKYNEEAVEWINSSDPYCDDPGINIDQVNDDRTVYLISDEDAGDQKCFDRWVRLNYQALFERELLSWYTDEDFWPADRSFDVFRRWFDIEVHTIIEDTVDDEIIDE